MKLFPWICVFLFPLAVFADGGPERRIDSLKKLLPKVADSAEAVVLRELTLVLAQRHPEEAITYGQRALLRTMALRNPELQATVQSALAHAYRHHGQSKKALDLNRQALDYYLNTGNQAGAASVYTNMSAVYMRIGRHALALEHAFDALKIYEELPPDQPKAYALERIANIYYEQRKLTKSSHYYELALNLYRKKGSPGDVARCIGNMARVHKASNNMETALEYLFKAYQIHLSTDDRYSAQINLANIGNVFLEQQQFDKAVQYHMRALEISLADRLPASVAINRGNLGITYFRIYQKRGEKEMLAKSISLLKQAVEGCKAVQQSVPQIEFGMILSEALYENAEHREAFAALRETTTLRDSVFSHQSRLEIHALETQRQLILKDKDLVIKNKQLEINKLETTQSTFLYISGIVLLTVASFYIIRRYRRRLQTHSTALSKIIHVQTHRIRGPVASILGLAQLLDQERPDNPDNSEIVRGISELAKELDEVVTQVIKDSN